MLSMTADQPQGIRFGDQALHLGCAPIHPRRARDARSRHRYGRKSARSAKATTAPSILYPSDGSAPLPLERVPIREPLSCGIRAIDGFLTCGRGQRVGIFGGSGVGKSTLIGMMARGTAADMTVLALVGERGREVGEFLEVLGEEGSAALSGYCFHIRSIAAAAHTRCARGNRGR